VTIKVLGITANDNDFTEHNGKENFVLDMWTGTDIKHNQLMTDTQWPAFNDYNTYCRVDKSQENDGADNCPDCLDGALLETLSDDLVEAVAHAAQLRRKSVRQRLMTSILIYRNCQLLLNSRHSF
jgi:hypothetical protein